MEEIAPLAYLHDFYGALLTPKQRAVWELHHDEDLSLTEIAAQEKMSRQAVHDLLRRTEKRLLNYEEKLGLAARFAAEKNKLLRLTALLAGAERRDFATEAAWRRHGRALACAEEMLTDILQ
ncbi:MAG: YlxM family DNA-binding protein [Gracilibacteraceae bacterium]|jgi:predicted DNA-binding protein YlxM (UPF0122 family)|nr:YlxM family DNA-binding protein [Gracilibacteraceae bacterium]